MTLCLHLDDAPIAASCLPTRVIRNRAIIEGLVVCMNVLPLHRPLASSKALLRLAAGPARSRIGATCAPGSTACTSGSSAALEGLALACAYARAHSRSARAEAVFLDQVHEDVTAGSGRGRAR